MHGGGPEPDQRSDRRYVALEGRGSGTHGWGHFQDARSTDPRRRGQSCGDVICVEKPGDRPRVAEFLRHDEWPFHGPSELASGDAIKRRFLSDDNESFWITDGTETAGLIQLLDLDDIGEGAPLFDLRIVEGRRGQGLGKRATVWLTDYLFATYPELHRIEANTGADNFAMQRVPFCSGFLHEGTL